MTKVSDVRVVSIHKVGNEGLLDVTWTVSPASADGSVLYSAAAPCTRGASFDGSCLPFANETQAMQGHASHGRATISTEGVYSARIALPNAYYAGLGTQYVPPAIQVSYQSGKDTYKGAARIADGVPYRTLTYPSIRTGPEFYAPQIPNVVMSQPAILYATGYPVHGPHIPPATTATTPQQFWWPGTR